jgi:predicted xylose isomerase-like sugar epimerase
MINYWREDIFEEAKVAWSLKDRLQNSTQIKALNLSGHNISPQYNNYEYE